MVLYICICLIVKICRYVRKFLLNLRNNVYDFFCHIYIVHELPFALVQHEQLWIGRQSGIRAGGFSCVKTNQPAIFRELIFLFVIQFLDISQSDSQEVYEITDVFLPYGDKNIGPYCRKVFQERSDVVQTVTAVHGTHNTVIGFGVTMQDNIEVSDFS